MSRRRARVSVPEAVAAGLAPWTDLTCEADLLAAVLCLARRCGWKACHYRPNLTVAGRWATAVQGDTGGQDAILARAGVVILAETKMTGGVTRPDQVEWADAAGPHGRIWYPRDWPSIVEELR